MRHRSQRPGRPGPGGPGRSPAPAPGRISRLVLLAVVMLLTAAAFAPALTRAAAENAEPPAPYLAFRVSGEIDTGLAAMLNRAVQQAEAGAPEVRALVLVINTPGGQVAAAERMNRALVQSKVPTLAFVEGNATSAGALIALSAEHLYMAPGTTIGDAEPIPYSDKAVSYVRGLFEAAAEVRGRDRQVAAAMVDKNVEIPGVTTGLPLNLTAARAEELGIADGVVSSLAEALQEAGLGEGALSWYSPTVSERVARFLTTSWVAGLLLLIGIGAFAVEFMTPGFGLPAGVGAIALALFFGTHMLVGTANWVEVGLVLLGIMLLAIEAFVPGFGIFGLGGVAALAAGIFMTAPDARSATIYLALATLGFLALVVAMARYLSRQGFIPWLTLQQRLDREGGYVPPRAAESSLLGTRGKTLTPLRPAGTAQLGPRRLDVVSEGEFIPSGTLVEVVAVDGTRVVVRAVNAGPEPPQA